MSDNPKIPRERALVVAQALYDRLSPFCEKCKVVGSLRRHRRFVGDIEFLIIPKLAPDPESLFTALAGETPEMIDMAGAVINRLLLDGVIKKRESENKRLSWGPLNKFAVHVESGIPVDFFFTDKEKWWVSLVIRTGGKATNLKLTMGANKRGLTLHAYGSGFTDRMTGEKIICTSEEDVFRIAGVPFATPEHRQ